MLKLLRQSIDYVEEHLHSPIEIEDIARSAMSSKYHFQRILSDGKILNTLRASNSWLEKYERSRM